MEITYETPVLDHLFRVYPNQHRPQCAHLEIDLSGEDVAVIRFGINYEIGNAVPVSVWNREILRIPVRPELSKFGQIEIFEDSEVVELISRICAGYALDYDGNNYRGRLSEDADSAEGELAAILIDDRWSLAEIWTAEAWVENMAAAEWRELFAGDFSEENRQRIASQLENACDGYIVGNMLTEVDYRAEKLESEIINAA